MSITHIIVGDMAAKQLQAAQALSKTLDGEILILKDTLGIGEIAMSDEADHTSIRTSFWKGIAPNWPEEQVVADTQNILTYLENIQEGDQAWFWMAPNVSDVSAYYWMLQYFVKHPGVLHTIFINSLPFFNEKGTLFYPKYFTEVLPKEMVKCIKLVKDVSMADFEVDGDEWPRLMQENGGTRIHEGGKKISSKTIEQYDGYFVNQFQFSNEFTKANKVMNQALSKLTDPVSDIFMHYRFKELIKEGKLEVNGDAGKALNQFEVRKGV